jgi:hypothetical protein
MLVGVELPVLSSALVFLSYDLLIEGQARQWVACSEGHSPESRLGFLGAGRFFGDLFPGVGSSWEAARLTAFFCDFWVAVRAFCSSLWSLAWKASTSCVSTRFPV